ncbi:MAG: bifunctional 4-hydroxy-3-methylbut-2-enyl diphosphate reductase/30S ribosomal protein S1 [Clostridiales bacterium]|nr:bifunctional 4-hydroxy-3-methylbut-2-enyl diphosphate reductase/30S ribosomal protein S1 [Clostridiales bacterium]
MQVSVVIARYAGFCNGVQRAMNMAFEAAEQAKREGSVICSLGELIHNPEALKRLEECGIRKVDRVEDAAEGYLLLRSHGEPPETYESAQKRGLKIIDCTCPSVDRLHKLVREHAARGLPVILVGDQGHPEVVGTTGWCRGGACYVVSSEREAEELPAMEQPLALCQTTFSAQQWDMILNVLRGKYPDITVKNTICNATANRQKEAAVLAASSDVMIVVGGRQSANTQKLFELCREKCPECYLVERAAELPRHIKYIHKKRIGITAGASTPVWSLKEVFAHMNDMEEKLEQATEELSEEEQRNKSFMDDVEKSMVRIHNGQTVTGTVVTITEDEVFVNIGYKADGIIKREDLVDQDVKVDDEIEVEVVKVNDGEGNVLLSQRNIINRKVWEDLMAKYQAGEYIEAVGKEAVKGGLIADCGGVRCFVPASRLARGYVEKIDKFVGEEMKLKIIDVDEKKKRVVASRKDVLAEEAASKKAAAWEKLEEGAVVTGIVRRFADFGAFVDLGGVDGLIHITDLAWHRVNNPGDVLTIGQEVEVKILSLDRERERIQLGYKQLQAKPWDNIEEKYPVGTIVERKVVRIAAFGAFVELEPGVDGLVHISQCALTHIQKVEDALTVGQDVMVKIMAVNPETKRITLSVREALADQTSPDEEVIDEDIAGEEAPAEE